MGQTGRPQDQEQPLFVTDRAAWDAQTDWTTGRWQPRNAQRPRPQWQPAPGPGVLSKRPLRFSEILDSGFRLIRFAPGASVGCALIVFTIFSLAVTAVIAGLIWLSFGYLVVAANSPDAAGGLSFLMQLGSGAVSLLSLSFLHFLSGLLAVPAHQAFFTPPGSAARDARGAKTTTLSQTWRAMAGVRWRLIAATALLECAHIVSLLIFLAPGVTVALISEQAVIGYLLAALGAFGWVVFTVFFIVRTAFIGCAITVERLSIGQAFSRSWKLTRRRFWATAGTLVLSYLLSSQLIGLILAPIFVLLTIVLTVIALTVGSGVTSVSPLLATVLVGMSVLTLALTSAATAVFFSYMSGVIAGLYYDRRMRFEGYDLILLREAELVGTGQDSGEQVGTSQHSGEQVGTGQVAS